MLRLAAVLLPLALAVGCSTAPERDEDAYLEAIKRDPEVALLSQNGTSDASWILTGDKNCGVIGTPGITRTDHSLGAAAERPDIGDTIVLYAGKFLCPEKRYFNEPAPAQAS